MPVMCDEAMESYKTAKLKITTYNTTLFRATLNNAFNFHWDFRMTQSKDNFYKYHKELERDARSNTLNENVT